jgi:threonine dehydratase
MSLFGARGTVVLPENTSPAKVETLRLYNARLEFYGDDCVKAELFAKKTAKENDLIWVSPYNDPQIIGGQGTIGIEIARQAEAIDAVLVPVGGGGLIGGIAGYLKSIDPSIEIIGCQPENSAVMCESVRVGRILDLPSKPTISDGSAGGIEPGAVTLDLCREHVDDWIVVTEEEIRRALRLLLERHYQLVEGSGALSVASYMKMKERFENRSVVCVVSGGKISLDILREVLEPM